MKTEKINLVLGKDLLYKCLVLANFYGMSLNQYVNFAIKTSLRKDQELSLVENKYLLFTKLEERASRRGLSEECVRLLQL